MLMSWVQFLLVVSIYYVKKMWGKDPKLLVKRFRSRRINNCFSSELLTAFLHKNIPHSFKFTIISCVYTNKEEYRASRIDNKAHLVHCNKMRTQLKHIIKYFRTTFQQLPFIVWKTSKFICRKFYIICRFIFR